MVKSLAAKSDNQIETYAFVEIFINFRSLLINANFGPKPIGWDAISRRWSLVMNMVGRWSENLSYSWFWLLSLLKSFPFLYDVFVWEPKITQTLKLRHEKTISICLYDIVAILQTRCSWWLSAFSVCSSISSQLLYGRISCRFLTLQLYRMEESRLCCAVPLSSYSPSTHFCCQK